MPHSLKNKVAFITGSTSGIGLGLAQSLAAEGADIMRNGFGDPAEIDLLRKNLTAVHGVRGTRRYWSTAGQSVKRFSASRPGDSCWGYSVCLYTGSVERRG